MTNKRPNTAELLQSNYTTVSVAFNDDVAVDDLLDDTVTPAQGQRYTYKADLSLELQVGDFVVVHANHRLAIAQVVKVDDKPVINPNATYEYKWIVDKIDTAGFVKRLQEQDAIKALLAQLHMVEAQEQLKDRLERASQHNHGLAQAWQAFQNKFR